MAMPLPPGLTPSEVSFLCEMEQVTVLPRQRLEPIQLLGGTTPALRPPHRADVPLWLALLLKRQRRANIIPPPWLDPLNLTAILEAETTTYTESFSPPPRIQGSGEGLPKNTRSAPFLPSAVWSAQADALPYHWLEMGEMLLEAAADDFEDPDRVRRLLRDLREVRLSKLRKGVEVLGPEGGVKLNGVGAMEVAEGRAFIGGVIDGLRKIGASREQAKKEKEDQGEEVEMADEDDDIL